MTEGMPSLPPGEREWLLRRMHDLEERLERRYAESSTKHETVARQLHANVAGLIARVREQGERIEGVERTIQEDFRELRQVIQGLTAALMKARADDVKQERAIGHLRERTVERAKTAGLGAGAGVVVVAAIEAVKLYLGR